VETAASLAASGDRPTASRCELPVRNGQLDTAECAEQH